MVVLVLASSLTHPQCWGSRLSPNLFCFFYLFKVLRFLSLLVMVGRYIIWVYIFSHSVRNTVSGHQARAPRSVSGGWVRLRGLLSGFLVGPRWAIICRGNSSIDFTPDTERVNNTHLEDCLPFILSVESS